MLDVGGTVTRSGRGRAEGGRGGRCRCPGGVVQRRAVQYVGTLVRCPAAKASGAFKIGVGYRRRQLELLRPWKLNVGIERWNRTMDSVGKLTRVRHSKNGWRGLPTNSHK